jgi:hypothetical protein
MSDDDFDYSRPAREWPIPWMDKAAGHKDTAFSWAMGELILARIAEGETVKAITADPRMPAYCTVFRWMQVAPEFGERVAEMRAVLAHNRRGLREARRLARGPKRRSGRKSTFSALNAALVIEGIEAGKSLSEIVREPGRPSMKAIYAWLRDQPRFRDDFVQACLWREIELDIEVEAAIDEAWGTGIPTANKRIRAAQGRAGRLRPKLYRWLPAHLRPVEGV